MIKHLGQAAGVPWRDLDAGSMPDRCSHFGLLLCQLFVELMCPVEIDADAALTHRQQHWDQFRFHQEQFP